MICKWRGNIRREVFSYYVYDVYYVYGSKNYFLIIRD